MDDTAWRDADLLSRGAHWSDAGPAWEAVAVACAAAGAETRCKEAWSRAADAYRRDDRPVAGARALRAAWDLGQDTTLDAAQLAAVLLDVGEVQAALDIATIGAARATDPVNRAVALDTSVGVMLAAARVDEARTALEALRGLGLPGGELAATFRAAQIARLDGDLSAAAAGFQAIVDATEGFPAAAGAEAAAWSELAELHELAHALTNGADHLAAAHAAVESAAEAWQRARRRAGRMRAEAWEVRLDRLRGLAIVPTPIHRALTYARERQLPCLEADLLGCLAVATRNPTDAGHALERLAGFPLARGRARVLQAECGGHADLGTALTELAGDGPWTERARRLVT